MTSTVPTPGLATAYLEWVRGLPQRPSIDELLILDAVGVEDDDRLLPLLSRFHVAEQLAGLRGPEIADGALCSELGALTGQGRTRLAVPLTDVEIEAITRVGHAVLANDRDNLDEWLAVADRIASADHTPWRAGVGFGDWYPLLRSTRRFIAAVIAAGRGPRYAHDLVDRGDQTGTRPDEYGFGSAITAAAFTDLATAGVTGADLDALARAGIDVADVLPLVADGCPVGAIIAAHREGIPKLQWPAMLRGLSPKWFPVGSEHAHEQHAHALGFSWEQLRELADNGWADVPLHGLSKVYYARGADVRLTPSDAVDLARAGVSHDDLARYAKALTLYRRDDRHATVGTSPLLGRARFSAEQIPVVVRLVAAGVKASHLDDYRFSGCRDVTEVIRAVNAGIDGPRVKHLRDTVGTTRGRYDKTKTIPNLAKLLAAHTEVPPKRTKRTVSTGA